MEKRSEILKNAMALLTSCSLLFSLNILACDIEGKSGFVPENNLKIPVGLKSLTGAGINETQFNSIIDRITLLYKKEIETKNRVRLVVEKNWKDPTVNAYAKQPGDGTWVVAMFGGLARHSAITADSFAVVMCHELGHHIGGAPKKLGMFQSAWASNEGQADYFGVMKCLRRLFEKENNVDAVKKLRVPALVKLKCYQEFLSLEERAICQRSSVAGLSLGEFFRSLSKDASKVDVGTPDKAIVKTTYDSHPKSQCRVDTYFQASLCDKSTKEEVSQTDANLGVCSKRNGDNVGLRPSCWYKEQI